MERMLNLLEEIKYLYSGSSPINNPTIEELRDKIKFIYEEYKIDEKEKIWFEPLPIIVDKTCPTVKISITESISGWRIYIGGLVFWGKSYLDAENKAKEYLIPKIK